MSTLFLSNSGFLRAHGTKDENATAQRLPSFFPDDVQQRWMDWAARTPSTLSDVPEEHRRVKSLKLHFRLSRMPLS